MRYDEANLDLPVVKADEILGDPIRILSYEDTVGQYEGREIQGQNWHVIHNGKEKMVYGKGGGPNGPMAQLRRFFSKNRGQSLDVVLIRNNNRFEFVAPPPDTDFTVHRDGETQTVNPETTDIPF